MSKYTQCNYCINKELIEQAKHDGLAITRKKEIRHGLGGFDVYIHPREINISKLSDEDRKRYFKVWFMKIGTKCEC